MLGLQLTFTARGQAYAPNQVIGPMVHTLPEKFTDYFLKVRKCHITNFI